MHSEWLISLNFPNTNFIWNTQQILHKPHKLVEILTTSQQLGMIIYLEITLHPKFLPELIVL